MKTTEHIHAPFVPNHLSNGDDALNNAVIETQGAVNKVTYDAEDPRGKFTTMLARQAADNSVAAATPVTERLGEQVNSNTTRNKLVEDLRNFVAANTLTSLGAALAAGFLLSHILR